MTRRVLLLALLSLLPYLGGQLDSSWQFDEWGGIAENTHYHSWQPWAWLSDPARLANQDVTPGQLDVRPAVLASFWASFRLFGMNPAGWHLMNWGIHLWCAVWVVLLARRLQFSEPWAWATGCLWAVHPISVVAVQYTWARSSSMTAACLLPALCVALDGDTTKLYLWYCAGLLVKAEAAGLIPVLLAAEFFLALPGKRWPRWAAVILPTAAYLAFRWATAPGWWTQTSRAGVSTAVYLLTQFRVWWLYVSRLPVPTDMCIDDMSYPWSSNIADPQFLIACLWWGAYLAVVWRLRKARPELAFLMVAGPLIGTPHSSVVKLCEAHNLHRFYLPSVFFFLAAAAVTRELAERLTMQRVVAVTWCCAVAVYGWASHIEAGRWKTTESFWAHHTTIAPGAFRARLNYAVALMAKGELIGAERNMKLVTWEAPQYSLAWVNLGIVYRALGRLVESEAAFSVASSLGFESAKLTEIRAIPAPIVAHWAPPLRLPEDRS